jgi:phosphoglycerate dehydrogenase-like enzyme
MIVYTDLHNRSKIYNIPEKFKNILRDQDIDIVTEYNDRAEVYWGDLFTIKDLNNLPNLKWIHFSCVGVNRALIPEVKERNILVTNSKGIFKEPVSTSIMSYILYFCRGLHIVNFLRNNNLLTRLEFDSHFNTIKNPMESSCLIVGYGDIGTRVGELCNSLGMEVNIVKSDLNVNFPPYIKNKYTLKNLKEAIKNNNFIINLLPLTKFTHNIFNKDIFTLMRNNSCFINVGRGKSVNEKDLIDILKCNPNMTAALDVFDTEPLPLNSPLWDMKNVLITPHIANLTKNYWDTQIELFIFNVNNYINNIPLKNIININKEY